MIARLFCFCVLFVFCFFKFSKLYQPYLKHREPKRAKNALVADIQAQATSVVPDRPKKSDTQKDVVRSFLPNMKPYDHRNELS